MIKLLEITNNLETSKYKIYLDMDGVIASFVDRYEHFIGKTPEDSERELIQKYGKKKGREAFWKPIDELGPKFWSEMDKTKDADELLAFLKSYDISLLSSPSRSNTSSEGKRIWANKHLPGTELILRQAKQKHEFAGPKNILIDDRADTCQRWKDAGGIAICHKNAKDTIKQLQELGFGKQLAQEIQAIPGNVPKFIKVDINNRNSDPLYADAQLIHNWAINEKRQTLSLSGYINLFFDYYVDGYVNGNKDIIDNLDRELLINRQINSNQQTRLNKINIDFLKYLQHHLPKISNIQEIQVIGGISADKVRELYRFLWGHRQAYPDYIKHLSSIEKEFYVSNSNDIMDLDNVSRIKFYNELLKFKKLYGLNEVNEIQVVSSNLPARIINDAKNYYENNIESGGEQSYKDFEIYWAFYRQREDEDYDGDSTISLDGDKPYDEYSREEQKQISSLLRRLMNRFGDNLGSFLDEDSDNIDLSFSFREDTFHPLICWLDIDFRDESYSKDIKDFFRIIDSHQKTQLSEIQVVSGNVPMFVHKIEGEQDRTGQAYEIDIDVLSDWLEKKGISLSLNDRYDFVRYWPYLKEKSWNDWWFGSKDNINIININFYNYLLKNIKKYERKHFKEGV